MITEDIAQVELFPEALNLIAVEPLTVREPALEGAPAAQGVDWQTSATARSELRDFYRALIEEEVKKLKKKDLEDVDSTDIDFSFENLSPFEQTRNEVPYAYTQWNPDTLLVAAVTLPGSDIPSASGLLIRNNLNVAEDYLRATTQSMDKIAAELFERPGSAVLNLGMGNPLLQRRRDSLRRHVEGEKLFLRDLYDAYTKGQSPQGPKR